MEFFAFSFLVERAKGQTKTKLFFQANVSSKKQTNKFYFYYETSGCLVFVRFWKKLKKKKKDILKLSDL